MNEESNVKNIGVINPFALTEMLMKKRVNWKRVTSPQNLLEKTLGMPYEQLFDPKFDSPLYAGLKLDAKNMLMEKIEIAVSAKGAHRALIDVEATTVWVDPGDFFEEGTEVTDPIQGALGDCYFIAAWASVAWARPYVIAQRTRATGVNQQDFVEMVEFYKNNKAVKVEVTEKMPLQSPGNYYIYARSGDTGEIWPCVYEKAYAKWRTKHTGDTPDYKPIAGGDPVGALYELTGLKKTYYANKNMSANAIWQKVRANSISKKTFNPMVAWTYSSSPGPGINYDSAHLVANHAYSILGWDYFNNNEYIILRNPWGTHEATLNVANITWTAWDQPYYGGPGWWRPIHMATKDGIFALRSDTFKSYFAGFGLVTTPEAP